MHVYTYRDIYMCVCYKRRARATILITILLLPVYHTISTKFFSHRHTVIVIYSKVSYYLCSPSVSHGIFVTTLCFGKKQRCKKSYKQPPLHSFFILKECGHVSCTLMHVFINKTLNITQKTEYQSSTIQDMNGCAYMCKCTCCTHTYRNSDSLI